ncbi:MAG: GIY-YIG nuclease family protein [Candidatus Pacebacteria bacterium]|nr:GIY-YIG nuclease family protein [Candidatus Paceibacterota bacterium]
MKKVNNACGVYAFLDKKGYFLYIGKAKNVKKRIKNHAFKKAPFVTQKIKIFPTDSEFSALILESSLIKKYKPKFNVLWKDDKEYFYLNKTNDKYPKIIVNHDKKGLGPFTNGKELKKALQALRYIFPFHEYKRHEKKKCSFCYLGLCPGPDISLKEYKKNIENIFSIFSGKKKLLINSFKKEMKKHAFKKEYEKAASLRDKIQSIEKVMSQTNIYKRMEAYDVSNLQGKQATGSMVVFQNGKACKNLYRKFKISLTKPNDTAMLKEILLRRLNHQEWPLPDFILIDGGKAQLNVALKIVKNIRIAALAKKNNELFFPEKKVFLKDLPEDFSNIILYMRDEAHRFAISYHKKLRERLD